jgi:hypothetical protein
MANQSTAYGLRPIGLVGSATNSTGVTQYEIASNNTNAIYQYGIVVPYGGRRYRLCWCHGRWHYAGAWCSDGY